MNYSAFLKWSLSHLDILQSLFSLVTAVVTAGTLAEKWNALKAIGDLLMPAISDFPSIATAGVETDEQLESSVCSALAALPSAQSAGALAWDGARLKAIWAVVGPLIPVLIGLLK